MPRLLEVFRDFAEGLETARSPLSPRRSLAGLKNCWLSQDDVGAVEAMPGFSNAAQSGLPVNFERFRALYRAEASDGTQLIVAVVDDTTGGGTQTVVKITPAGSISTLKTGLTYQSDVSIVVINDRMLFFNGNDTPFEIKIDDETVTDLDYGRPDVTTDDTLINVSLGAGAGTLTNVIQFYLAEITGVSEGALSAAMRQSGGTVGIDCGTGDDVTITAALWTSGASKTYKIYRSLPDLFQPFDTGVRLTVDGSGNGSATVDGSETLGGLPFLHGDPPPAAITSAVVHFSRVWGLAGSDLYWSDLAKINATAHRSWWTEANGNKATIYPDDGDTGTALARTANGILVFKEHHLYHAFGRIPDQLEIQEVTLGDQNNRSVGTPSVNSLVRIPGGYAFYYNKGVYLYLGGSLIEIGQDIEDDLRGIRNQDEIGTALGYEPQRRLLYVSVPTAGTGTAPDKTYIYDLHRRMWIGYMSCGFRHFAVIEDANGNEEFWAAGGAGTTASAGIVYQLNDGTDHDGTAISTELEIPPFTGRNPTWIKSFEYVEPVFAPQASGSVTVSQILNGFSGSSDDTSVSMVAANQDRHKRRVNLGWKGRDLGVKITSNADQPAWKMYGVNYGFMEEAGVSN